MATRKLTIRLPEEEIDFARNYATLHYLLARHADRQQADGPADWLLVEHRPLFDDPRLEGVQEWSIWGHHRSPEMVKFSLSKPEQS